MESSLLGHENRVGRDGTLIDGRVVMGRRMLQAKANQNKNIGCPLEVPLRDLGSNWVCPWQRPLTRFWVLVASLAGHFVCGFLALGMDNLVKWLEEEEPEPP